MVELLHQRRAHLTSTRVSCISGTVRAHRQVFCEMHAHVVMVLTSLNVCTCRQSGDLLQYIQCTASTDVPVQVDMDGSNAVEPAPIAASLTVPQQDEESDMEDIYDDPSATQNVRPATDAVGGEQHHQNQELYGAAGQVNPKIAKAAAKQRKKAKRHVAAEASALADAFDPTVLSDESME